MRLDYFVYELSTGRLLQRLSCSSGKDRKANVALQYGRGAVLAGDIEGLPDDKLRVDLATRTLVPVGGA